MKPNTSNFSGTIAREVRRCYPSKEQCSDSNLNSNVPSFRNPGMFGPGNNLAGVIPSIAGGHATTGAAASNSAPRGD